MGHTAAFSVICAILCFSCCVMAQNMAVPSSWKHITSDHSYQELLSLIDGVLNTVNLAFDTSSGQFNGMTFGIQQWPHPEIRRFHWQSLIGLEPLQSASMVSALSLGDLHNGTRTSETLVNNSLELVFTLTPNITGLNTPGINDEPAIWGLAALDSYRAYGNQQSLDYAQTMWKQLSSYVVTPDQVAINPATHPMRNVSFHGVCGSNTNAGAVFYYSGITNDTRADAQSTATYMALSAYLYEHTKDESYLAAAKLSADFVLSQLTNGNVILDNMDMTTCHKSSTLYTSNSAYTIYGLSALAASDSDGYASKLSGLISTVIPNPQWTNASDGVNFEGPPNATAAESAGPHGALKGILIRSLYEAYKRIPSDSPEAILIQSYINVQLNAILSLATSPGSNQYSVRWEGPPTLHFLLEGQLGALDPLYVSLGLLLASSNSNSTPSPTNSSSPNDSEGTDNTAHGISSGAIGGIVGGILGSFLLLALTIFIIRKRKQSRNNALDVEEAAAHPYTEAIPSSETQDELNSTLTPTMVTTSKYSREQSSSRLQSSSCFPPGDSPGPSTSSQGPSTSSQGPSTSSPGPSTTSSPGPSTSQSPSSPNMGHTAGAGGPVTVDMAAFTALVDRLNRAISPRMSGEAPPSYEC